MTYFTWKINSSVLVQNASTEKINLDSCIFFVFKNFPIKREKVGGMKENLVVIEQSAICFDDYSTRINPGDCFNRFDNLARSHSTICV